MRKEYEGCDMRKEYEVCAVRAQIVVCKSMTTDLVFNQGDFLLGLCFHPGATKITINLTKGMKIRTLEKTFFCLFCCSWLLEMNSCRAQASNIIGPFTDLVVGQFSQAYYRFLGHFSQMVSSIFMISDYELLFIFTEFGWIQIK